VIKWLAEPYISVHRTAKPLEIWKPGRRVKTIPFCWPLRIQAPADFRLRWTNDDWRTIQDTRSTGTSLGVDFVDIKINPEQKSPIIFTFYWMASEKWEGRDYQVNIYPNANDRILRDEIIVKQLFMIYIMENLLFVSYNEIDINTQKEEIYV
jgi:hypothetical protein